MLVRLPLTLLLALLAPVYAAAKPAKRTYSSHAYYVIEHEPRAGASLDEVARSLGVEVVERAGELENHWLVRQEFGSTPLARGLDGVAARDPVIETFDVLQARAASKRQSHFSRRSNDVNKARRVVSSVKYLARQELRQRHKRELRAPPPIIDEAADHVNASDVALRMGLIDPLFTEQWHIVNDEFPQYMMGVVPVWEEFGYTGTGVITAFVDDGLDYRSPDLAANFDADDSYDFNDHTDLPTPVLFDDHHGTRCAGQVGAVKNDKCGIGLAYDSKVAGLRILSGPISDVDEATALNYGYQNVTIYSCSWGPPDDGRSMEGPDYLIAKAIVNGIQKGRDGKGSLFVFASGNGAAHGDQCNFDGYVNSIYSITVAAVDFKGLHPYYSESCAANLISAYSSGSGNHIVTTDINDQCAKNHGGTSAAAPNAAGVIALAMEARPDLTWRDVQHLAIQSAVQINPEDPDWEDTAIGKPFSYKYGYGTLNGYELVKAAKDWKNVKPQAWFETPTSILNNGTMNILKEMDGGQFIPPDGLKDTISITQDMLTKHNFEGLEHVVVKVWIRHTRRGQVSVDITSPKGIKSVLAAPRKYDAAATGFPGWTFMSRKHWGDEVVGDWTLRVSDQNETNQLGYLLGWNIKFYGSTIDPSLAKEYENPSLISVLPPPESNDTVVDETPKPSTTKTHPKPTANLPPDHGSAEGEKEKPAFDAAEPSSTPTPDEGWFPDMASLLNNKKWFFGVVAVVLLFCIGAGAYFWRRRILRRRRAQYSALGGDDMAMRHIPGEGGTPRTRELYDAFGEVSDDEDADEETGLRGGRPQDRSPGGLGFHQGFLDDDDPPSAPHDGGYKDEPDPVETEEKRENADSPDGSWEHASQSR